MERGEVTVYELRFQRGGLRETRKKQGVGNFSVSFQLRMSPVFPLVTLAQREILNLPGLLSVARFEWSLYSQVAWLQSFQCMLVRLVERLNLGHQ